MDNTQSMDFFFNPLLKAIAGLKFAWIGVMTAWLSAFFGESLIDMVLGFGPFAKVLSGAATLVAAAATYFLSRREKNAAINKLKIEIENEIQESRFERINQLITLGWITEASTDEEIQAALERLAKFK